jgi:hypothetical protein
MTGLLVLSADPAANLGAATKQYVDGKVPPLANTSVNGLLKQVSGTTTDYVGGDNACHPMPVWTVDNKGIVNGPYQRRQFYDDLLGQFGTVITNQILYQGTFPWYATFSTTGGSVSQSLIGNDIYNKTCGVLSLIGPATSPANAITLYSGIPTMPGLGALDLHFRVAFKALPTSASPTQFIMGLLDLINLNSEIFMGLNWDGTAASWTGGCQNVGIGGGQISSIYTPSIVPFSATAATFYKMHISINAAWNSISMFVNNVQVGSVITTNIPSTIPMSLFLKFNGFNNALYVDQIFVDYQYFV